MPFPAIATPLVHPVAQAAPHSPSSRVSYGSRFVRLRPEFFSEQSNPLPRECLALGCLQPATSSCSCKKFPHAVVQLGWFPNRWFRPRVRDAALPAAAARARMCSEPLATLVSSQRDYLDEARESSSESWPRLRPARRSRWLLPARAKLRVARAR